MLPYSQGVGKATTTAPSFEKLPKDFIHGISDAFFPFGLILEVHEPKSQTENMGFHLVKTPGKIRNISRSDKFPFKPTGENNIFLSKWK